MANENPYINQPKQDTNGQVDYGEMLKWFYDSRDKDSMKMSDTGWSNFWNVMQMAAQQQAYERSMPENQVELMMKAGMSRQAALAAVQGLDTSAAAPAWNNAVAADTQSATTIADSVLSGVQGVASLGGQVYQNYLGYRQIRGDKLVEPIAAEVYDIINDPNEAIPPDEAKYSPENFKRWCKAQPIDSRWHKVVNSDDWRAMARDLYGQKAFRREFMENMAARTPHQMEFDAVVDRATRFYGSRIAANNMKLIGLQFERGTVEFDQYQQIAQKMTDQQSAQLDFSIWQINQQTTPYMKKMYTEKLVKSAEYDALKAQTEAAMQSNFKDMYLSSPSYQNAVAVSAMLDSMGIDDNGLGAILRGANVIGSGVVNESMVQSTVDGITNAMNAAFDSLRPQSASSVPAGQPFKDGTTSASNAPSSIDRLKIGASHPFDPIGAAKETKQLYDNEQNMLSTLDPNKTYKDGHGTFKVVSYKSAFGKTIYKRKYQ